LKYYTYVIFLREDNFFLLSYAVVWMITKIMQSAVIVYLNCIWLLFCQQDCVLETIHLSIFIFVVSSVISTVHGLILVFDIKEMKWSLLENEGKIKSLLFKIVKYICF